jgi:hypothetical protein
MRKLISMLTVAVLCSGLTLVVKAAAEKTIVGEGQCAKCSLGETKTCQNVVVTKEEGTYYLAQNAVSKAFHKNVCQTIKTVRATGEVSEDAGKKVLTASKIEVVEE